MYIFSSSSQLVISKNVVLSKFQLYRYYTLFAYLEHWKGCKNVGIIWKVWAIFSPKPRVPNWKGECELGK